MDTLLESYVKSKKGKQTVERLIRVDLFVCTVLYLLQVDCMFISAKHS